MNQVKIVSTIGPKTLPADQLSALHNAGMDMIRLNGSHGTFEWHIEAIKQIRSCLPDVPILLDLPGSKVRTSMLDHPVQLTADQIIVLTPVAKVCGEKIPINNPNLHIMLRPGDHLYIDDGTMEFVVVEIKDEDVVCRVCRPGILNSGKGIQLQGAPLRGAFLSDRDLKLISLAREQKIDFIGVSFVESAQQIIQIRSLLGKDGPAIIAKVETQSAVDHLDEIIPVSDALMIDRGDLSVETNLENIVLLQKSILQRANRVACPVIVATQLLHTMIDHSDPTKAEISDITNAVLDGATALMLSGETAVGKYPIEAVQTMRRVADVVSNYMLGNTNNDDEETEIPQAISEAIALLCSRLKITKIVVITRSGFAAKMVAAQMPRQPIIAVSDDPASARKFNLLRGVSGFYSNISFSKTSTDHISQCLEALWRNSCITKDDIILVTAVGYPKSGNRMNLLETHRVSDLIESLKWNNLKRT